MTRDMLCASCGRRHSEGRFLFLRKSPSGDHQSYGLCSPECEREHAGKDDGIAYREVRA